MASLHPSRRPKGKGREIIAHPPEIIEYATYAAEHLSDMVSILKHHTDAQNEALGTAEEPSSKDSQSLAKTILSLYKQMDCYMAILHPPRIEDAECPENSILPDSVPREKKEKSLSQETVSTHDSSLSNEMKNKQTDTLAHPVKTETSEIRQPNLNIKKDHAQSNGYPANRPDSLRDNQTLQAGMTNSEKANSSLPEKHGHAHHGGAWRKSS